jgi:5-methylcytosine-specific restriction endonuclease McrA
MSDIPISLVRSVNERAMNRCEYCGLSQIGQEAKFHIDHVVPRSADSPTDFENLALACVSCSLRKGARLIATDPDSQADVPFFNPRTMK